MPLIASTLANALQPLMDGSGFPKTPDEAAQRWAQAYLSYAQGAISPTGGTPTNVAASQPGMQSALAAAFSAPNTTAQQTAQAFGQALVAFWTPVLFAGAAVGTVLTAAAAGPLAQSGLIAAWAALLAGRASGAQAAQQIAAALDAASHTVIVLDTLPLPAPPVIGPIS